MDDRTHDDSLHVTLPEAGVRSTPHDAAMATLDFEELYRRHAGDVHGMALRMLCDAREAEELTQNILVHVWQNFHRFNGGSLAAWIFRVSRNYLLNDARTKARLSRRLSFDDDVVGATANATPVSLETMMSIETAIAGLSPGQRMVFTMHDVEGFSTSEVAEVLGIAAATVRVHLSRARKAIGTVLRA
ncbi:MAG TPA: sigma-70 family RNA polymerase sigma factor [Gemmatimonas sp.]|nr:sigma-70 family RNA polymerase sigma factor [Gemmatimonas sp.]